MRSIARLRHSRSTSWRLSDLKLGNMSKTLRSFHKIIQQGLVERVVGRQLDAVDCPVAAFALYVVPPLIHRRQVTLADPFGVGRQLFARFQVTKTDVPFER